MKTTDFSFPLASSPFVALLGLVICFTANAAEPPPPESFTQPTELVLTLSDQWLEAGVNQNGGHALHAPAGSASENPIRDKFKNRPVNVGCGMDVNPTPTDDNSLTSRLVGECNLDYRY